MLRQLGQLHLGHIHQRIHLILGPFKVLDTKRIYRNHLYPRLITNLQYLHHKSAIHPKSIPKKRKESNKKNIPSPKPQTPNYAPPLSQSDDSSQTVYSHPSQRPHVSGRDPVSGLRSGVPGPAICPIRWVGTRGPISGFGKGASMRMRRTWLS